MVNNLRACVVAIALAALQTCSAYDMLREYAGSSFFDAWDFYGYWDNLTLGKLSCLHDIVSLTTS